MFVAMLIDFFLVVFLTPFVSSTALAAPAKPSRPLPCHDLIKQSFSVGYNWSGAPALSLAQCMQQSIPRSDACVFYTAGDRDNAIAYASQNNITTIYDVYAPQWFNTSACPAKEWKERGVLRKVFQVTSRAYAMSCTGQASLVVPLHFNPCPTSIWVTDEYDAIRNKLSKITVVMKVSLVQKVNGTWKWVVEKLAGDSLASNWMRRRGIENVFNLQKIMENKASVMEKLSLAASFDEDDVWAVHADSSCKYSTT